MIDSSLSGRVIGAAIEVHKTLGPGLLESAYELALEHELALMGHLVERQKPVQLSYKGIELGDALRLDLIVDDSLIVEIKSIEQIAPLHESQLLTYLRLTGAPIGLLINFNVRVLKEGIRRISN
ncbi:MAG: GxxExxY protein [Rhodocyclaceae bacterium]|nr:MAG: GxxExxY protein [Rhodocyclaceae bacterium]